MILLEVPINLTWTDGTPAASSLGNPANEIGFRIERSANGGAFAILGTALANATAFADSTVVSGVGYTYRVVAYNAAGDTPSNSVNVTINANLPPQIISVTASPNAIFDTNISQLLVTASDPDSGPAPLTYQWTVMSGQGTLSSPTIANPIYTPPDVTAPQTFTLSVQVSDGQAVVTGTVNVTVYDSIILSADFASSAQGFVYADDTFRGTSQPVYSSGWFSPGYLGFGVGGINNVEITGMSGGWRRTFTVPPASGSVRLSVRYMMTQTPGFEPSEYTDVLVSLDGVLLGTGANDYVARIIGDGDGGAFLSTQLRWYNRDLGTLTPGNHTLIVGGFLNHKNSTDELAAYRFEDVILAVTGPGI